jgi:glucan phosphorylase
MNKRQQQQQQVNSMTAHQTQACEALKMTICTLVAASAANGVSLCA